MVYKQFLEFQLKDIVIGETRKLNIRDKPIPIVRSTIRAIAADKGISLSFSKPTMSVKRIEAQGVRGNYRQFIADQLDGMVFGDIRVVDIGNKPLTLFRATIQILPDTYKTSQFAGVMTVERIPDDTPRVTVRDIIWPLELGRSVTLDDCKKLRWSVYHLNKVTDRRFKFIRSGDTVQILRIK